MIFVLEEKLNWDYIISGKIVIYWEYLFYRKIKLEKFGETIGKLSYNQQNTYNF